MEQKIINIPKITIQRIEDKYLNVVYYDLYLDGTREGRYSDVGSINWRIGLLICNEVIAL